jgi:hypothetical protein
MALLSPGRKDAAPSRDESAIRRNRGEKAARDSDLATMVKDACRDRRYHIFG